MNARLLALAAFVVGVVAVGSFIGLMFPAGEWHASLVKPSFNPPNWLFAPVWTTLYVLIGIAGWRAWYKTEDAPLRQLWLLQMVLNFAWSPAFFGAESPLLGLIVILPMLAAIIAFALRAWRVDPISTWLFVPYIAWVSFATMLTAAIYRLN